MRSILWFAVLNALAPVVAQDYDVVLLRPSRYLAQKPNMNGEVHKYMQNVRNVLDFAGLRHHSIDEETALSEGIATDEFQRRIKIEVVDRCGTFAGGGCFTYAFGSVIRYGG